MFLLVGFYLGTVTTAGAEQLVLLSGEFSVCSQGTDFQVSALKWPNLCVLAHISRKSTCMQPSDRPRHYIQALLIIVHNYANI